MDDQSPLNPLLGSIFATQPTTQLPTAEGGQLQAPVPETPALKFPVLEEPATQPIQVQAPEQIPEQNPDVCRCSQPGCAVYRMARSQGMPRGANPDLWGMRAVAQAQIVKPKQQYVCPGCGGDHGTRIG